MSKAENPTLGLDIGSVNTHLALIKGKDLIHLDQERNYRGLNKTVEVLMERLPSGLSFAGAGVTGSGRHAYDEQPDWKKISTPYADIAGVLWDQSDPHTIVEIGGQGALVIGLEDGLNKSWKVARSPLCAAGTGRFLEQQSKRLEISIEEFGPKALECNTIPPRIAARCSVFAKSDLIHLQQKGVALPPMLAGLSDSVAQMIISQWRDKFKEPIVFIGGVANNQGITKALAKAIGTEQLVVPTHPDHRGAIGAAILAQENEVAPKKLYPVAKDVKPYHITEKLKSIVSEETWKPSEIVKGTHVSIGFDIGSTSTKAVIIDKDGKVLAKVYLMTAGQPLEAVKQIAAELSPLQDKVIVDAVGITGSGRYLVGDFVGADLIKNEITAQVWASRLIDSQVDTIFELGGQDSKYVYLKNGTVLNYNMNKACAAGTGSFIDELAEQLGISTRTGEFARKAFEAKYQIYLGERCTAFMSQAVTAAQQQGEPLDVIIASLATSLAKNYKSKVVGTDKVGDRIFLTGAVFYNDAVVSAFRNEFPGKTFVIPEHKEVTGAIGAALLAKEAMGKEGIKTKKEVNSKFKGFPSIANETYELTSFNCQKCEHNCAISAMTTRSDGGEERKSFYGSRCDSFDSRDGLVLAKKDTPFTDREKLLFADYYPAKGIGKKVGIPRALMTHDLAPLIIGFLNDLGVKIEISNPTNNGTIKHSLDRAYTDSCYPIKLLHGHVDELLSKNVDYILILNAIRMGEKSGEEDQHYSCPLVQAAPYISKSVFNLGGKLLDPVIDFSRGDKAVINSFAEIAVRLGFSKKEGLKAALAGLKKQKEFEQKLQEKGKELLKKLEENPDLIGVVLLSRAYNAQDQGANMAMTDELEKLGVIPIPLDFLPLSDINVKEISDRPYWNYQRKILAASKLISSHPQLFGLFLSNFGCGPNSFIQTMVADIMGGKPLGKIEIDEHAAEAGLITRLEAFADNIRGYYKSGLNLSGKPEHYRRFVSSGIETKGDVVLPYMADHAKIIAAAMRAYGVDARVLPPSDKKSMELSRDVTNGAECLPFRDTIGQILREWKDGNIKPDTTFGMAGSFGPCRLGQYGGEQQAIYRKLEIPIRVLTSVSNKAYGDIGLDRRFELLAYKGIRATDALQKMLWRTRPYEKSQGQANATYKLYLEKLVELTEQKKDLAPLLRKAREDFIDIRDFTLPQRPVVGANGEIYLRSNDSCNNNMVVAFEDNGLEVVVSPMAEWFDYVNFRNLEDAIKNRDLAKITKAIARRFVTKKVEERYTDQVEHVIFEREHTTEELLKASSTVLPSRNGSEAVLSLGSGIKQMQDPRFAAVISVMPHGCMPGGIVAALAEQISRKYGKPWISLTYDGSPESVNSEKIADLAEQLCHRRSA